MVLLFCEERRSASNVVGVDVELAHQHALCLADQGAGAQCGAELLDEFGAVVVEDGVVEHDAGVQCQQQHHVVGGVGELPGGM